MRNESGEMKKIFLFIGLALALGMTAQGQEKGLTDMGSSRQAKMKKMPLGSVRWTGGST